MTLSNGPECARCAAHHAHDAQAALKATVERMRQTFDKDLHEMAEQSHMDRLAAAAGSAGSSLGALVPTTQPPAAGLGRTNLGALLLPTEGLRKIRFWFDRDLRV